MERKDKEFASRSKYRYVTVGSEFFQQELKQYLRAEDEKCGLQCDR